MTTDPTPVTVDALFTDAFTRTHDDLRDLLAPLDVQALAWRVSPDANPIGWLAWHLTRVQDDHLAGITGEEQVWTAAGFAARFDLPYPTSDHGYGHSSEQVAQFRLDGPDLLLEYADAVHDRTLVALRSLTAQDLTRVVDDSYDPPVTAAVRLVSVVNDVTQHVGQIGYVSGLLNAADLAGGRDEQGGG